MVKDYNFDIFEAADAQLPLRLAFDGASGDGKTYSALAVARELVGGDMSQVIVLDTENSSSAKYRKQFPGFKILPLNDDYHPDRFVGAINFAEKKGYKVIIVDSLSHAWNGKNGALEQVDKAAAKSHNNTFGAGWKEVTPMQNRLIDAILTCTTNLIVTMRSKTEYVVEQNSHGKSVPKKVGTKPVQRDGMDYEFDVVIHVGDAGKKCVVTKTRCSELAGEVIEHPGAELAHTLVEWLSGVDPKTLPMAKETFIDVCAADYGASPDDIGAAIKEAKKAWAAQDAPELLKVVEEYMASLAEVEEPVEEAVEELAAA